MENEGEEVNIEQNERTIGDILHSVYFTDIKDETGVEDREEALEYFLNLDELRFQTKISNLLNRAKVRMLKEMGQNGPDIIIKETFDENESQQLLGLDFGAKINKIAEKISLSNCYYYYSHFNHYRSSIFLYKIPLEENRLRTNMREELSNSIENMTDIEMKGHFKKALNSSYGVPLLEPKIMMNIPIPHIIKIEDDKHVYFEFWEASKEKRDIDLSSGDFSIIRTPIQISCRLCLGSSFLEIWSSHTSLHRIKRVASLTHDVFGLQFQDNPYSIEEQHMRTLEGIARRISHESHSGRTNTSFTAPDPHGNTRNDPDVIDLSRRPYREAHFLIDVPPLNDQIIFGISEEKDYIVIFRQNLSSTNKIKAIEYIVSTLGLI